MQYKSNNLQLKDVDTKNGIVVGYFASFDNIDSDGDVFVKGAFSKTIKENGPSGTGRIQHLLQHDVLTPIGKIQSIEEDAKGLRFESKMSSTTKGQDTLTLYAEGILREHSVGFQTIVQEQVEKGDQYNEIREVKLWEGSTVTWGANSQTPFEGFKSDNPQETLSVISRLKASLRLGLTDETLKSIEIYLTQLEQSLKSRKEHSEPSQEQLLEQFKQSFKQSFNKN